MLTLKTVIVWFKDGSKPKATGTDTSVDWAHSFISTEQIRVVTLSSIMCIMLTLPVVSKE